MTKDIKIEFIFSRFRIFLAMMLACSIVGGVMYSMIPGIILFIILTLFFATVYMPLYVEVYSYKTKAENDVSD